MESAHMNIDPSVLATEDEQKRGWRVSLAFLSQVSDAIAQNHDAALPLSQIEAVLLAASRLLIGRAMVK